MGKPARLPNGAPDGLRGFVACTVDRVELDLGEMGWIPKPPGIDNLPEPGVSVNEGWTPTTATMKVGWGFVSMELPASIVDGSLHIDSSNLMFEGVGTEINRWVDAFNTTLRDNDKQLDTFDVRNNKVTMTKRAIPAGADPRSTGVAPVASTVPSTSPDGDPEEKKSPPGGCLTWVLAGITAIAVAVGLWAVTNDGDDETSTGSDPAPASSSTTSTTTSTTTTTTTTIAQVGQAPPPVTPDDPQVACGEFPAGSAASEGSYLVVGAPATCDPTPGAYQSSNCNTAYIPCSFGQAPGIIFYGGSGTNHSFGAVDADTGVPGASTQSHSAYVRMFQPGPHVLRLRAICGGTELTGQAPVNTAGATIIEQPLQSFGNCEIQRLEAAAEEYVKQNDIDIFDPAAVGRAAAAIRERAFTVDASESDPVAPDFMDKYTVSSEQFTVPDNWSDAVNTLQNVVAASPATNDCFWFFSPDNVDLVVNVLDGCARQDHYWVFAATTNNADITFSMADTTLATTSTFANPLGVVAPPTGDTSAFATGDPLFNNTVFPCGYGHVAYTACPADEPTVDGGAFVTVSGVMLDAVPIEGDDSDRSHRVDFGSGGGPAYTLVQSADGWLVESSAGSTQARALFRDNAITLVVPQIELPKGDLASAWSTTVDGETVTQPAIPVVGLLTTPEVLAGNGEPAIENPPATTETPETPEPTDPTLPAPAESLESFYEQLSASVAAGDGGFALDRLHPIVSEAYPSGCTAALESFADPDLVIAFVSDNGPDPWTWALSDGRSFDVPDAIGVTLKLTGRGQSGDESTAHVVIVDGEYRWFTFCGDA